MLEIDTEFEQGAAAERLLLPSRVRTDRTWLRAERLAAMLRRQGFIARVHFLERWLERARASGVRLDPATFRRQFLQARHYRQTRPGYRNRIAVIAGMPVLYRMGGPRGRHVVLLGVLPRMPPVTRALVPLLTPAREATAERQKDGQPRPACTPEWVPRPEGSVFQLRHNQFAAYMVAKLRIPGASPEMDYRVWLDGRKSCDYDSFDFLSRTYYEFKTRHGYMPFDERSATWFAMSRILPQAEKQAMTIAMCDPGAQLLWIFDSKAVADAVRPAIAPFVNGVGAVKWNRARMP